MNDAVVTNQLLVYVAALAVALAMFGLIAAAFMSCLIIAVVGRTVQWTAARVAAVVARSVRERRQPTRRERRFAEPGPAVPSTEALLLSPSLPAP